MLQSKQSQREKIQGEREFNQKFIELIQSGNPQSQEIIIESIKLLLVEDNASTIIDLIESTVREISLEVKEVDQESYELLQESYVEAAKFFWGIQEKLKDSLRRYGLDIPKDHEPEEESIITQKNPDN